MGRPATTDDLDALRPALAEVIGEAWTRVAPQRLVGVRAWHALRSDG